MRNLPDEAMSGVVNDTTLAKPPTPLDTGLRRYDGCAKVSPGEKGLARSTREGSPIAGGRRWRGEDEVGTVTPSRLPNGAAQELICRATCSPSTSLPRAYGPRTSGGLPVSDAAAFDAFRDGVRQRYDALSRSADPNEAVTEQELIRPVLELLGWADYLPQQGAARNEDIPDLLLFPDADSKERAAARGSAEARYRDAIVVEESKRFGLALDARDREDGRRSRTPHGQLLRYLSTAEVESEGGMQWGILTSGGVWRLYDYRARPRATGYFEADLGSMLEPGGDDHLRLFYLLFRRGSFILQEGATTTFLEDALMEGRRYDEKVAQDLSSVVFERVFPKLVEGLGGRVRGRAAAGPRGRADLPVSTVVRALRRGPRAAPRQRLPV